LTFLNFQWLNSPKTLGSIGCITILKRLRGCSFLRKESEGGRKVEGKKESPWFGTKEHDKGKKLIHGPHKNILSAQICEETGRGQIFSPKRQYSPYFFIMYSPMLFFLIYTPLFFWKWQTCLVQLMYHYSSSSKYLILYLILLIKHIFLCVDMHVNYYLYIRVLMSFIKYTSFFSFTFSLIPNNLKIILYLFHFLFIFIP